MNDEPTPFGLRVTALVIGSVGYAWSTFSLLTEEDPGTYSIALGLAASVILGWLITTTYEAWRSRR